MSRNGPRSFLRLMAGAQWRIARRQIDGLRQKSRLMVVVIGLFVIAYWLASYFMFLHGFHFLGQLPGVGSLVQGRILYLFFAFLFVMLFISNIVIGYASLYKSEETQWMLSLPVDAREVFRWKMLETTILASWAFLFLSAPLILAYAWQQQAGPWFCLKTFAALLPFAVIPAGLGVMTVIVLTRYLSRRVFKVGLVGLGALAIVASLVWIKPAVSGGLQQAQLLDAFQQLLRHSRIAMSPLLPSYWLVQSMIAWGESWSWKGTFYFLVGLSNALLIMTVSTAISGRIFYSSWSRNRSQGNFRPGRELPETAAGPRSWMLEPALGLIPRLDACTRALIVKDIRLFRRDTAQWGQFVIFFGLLGLYVVNLRNVTYDTADPVVGAFVAFLNMMAASMTLGTLTTRFIFPQFSLEGKRLWIVGMVPQGLKRVVLQKFWLSSVVSTATVLSLTTVSCWMLRVPGWLTLLFSATAVMMAFALCGIAVGLGALLPSFSTGPTARRLEDNPARIVSSFGGTFCFVLSLTYIVLVVLAEAIPIWWYLIHRTHGPSQQPLLLVASWLVVATISLVAATVPMQLALNRLERTEF